MRENGMTSGNSVIFKGVRDWRSSDIGVIEKCIAGFIILGLLSNVISSEYVDSIYAIVSMMMIMFFLVGPAFMYYINFKSEEGRYIFITPVKKSYVLLTSLGIWGAGFIVFVICRLLIIFMVVNPLSIIKGVDILYMFLDIINTSMIILSVYAVIISIDIITVVKNIPKIATYTIGAALVLLRVYIPEFISRGYIPEFIVYKGMKKFDIINFLIQPTESINNSSLLEGSVTVGPNLLIFLISLILFIYALSIFEEYNGESDKGFLKKYIL